MKLLRAPAVLVFIVLVLLVTLAGCAQPSVAPTTTAPTSAPPTTTKPATTTTAPTVPAGPYGELRIALSSFYMETIDPIKGSVSETTVLASPYLDFLIENADVF